MILQMGEFKQVIYCKHPGNSPNLERVTSATFQIKKSFKLLTESMYRSTTEPVWPAFNSYTTIPVALLLELNYCLYSN